MPDFCVPSSKSLCTMTFATVVSVLLSLLLFCGWLVRCWCHFLQASSPPWSLFSSSCQPLLIVTFFAGKSALHLPAPHVCGVLVVHVSSSASNPICLLFAGWLLRCHLLRGHRLLSSWCTTGFPGAAASCLLTSFLSFTSCLLASCYVDASASHTLEPASLPPFAPPLSLPSPLDATGIPRVLKCMVHPPSSQLSFSSAASCPPQLVVAMPLATPLPLVVPKNNPVHPLPLAEQQKSVANGVGRVIRVPNSRWFRGPVKDAIGQYLLIIITAMNFWCFFGF